MKLFGHWEFGAKSLNSNSLRKKKSWKFEAVPAEFPVDDISSYLHQAAGLVKRIPSLFDEILRHEKEKKRRDGHHQLIRRLFHHISQDIIDRPSQIKKKKVHCHDRKITNNFFLVVAKKNKTRPTTRGINSWAIRFLLLFDPITNKNIPSPPHNPVEIGSPTDEKKRLRPMLLFAYEKSGLL